MLRTGGTGSVILTSFLPQKKCLPQNESLDIVEPAGSVTGSHARRQLPETIVGDRTKLVGLVTRNGERGERDAGIW